MLGVNEQSGVVTTGPWPARDGYVAETAIKLDRLQAKLDRLERQNEQLKQHVAELLEEASQTKRLQSFEESLRNARDYKIDDVLRCVKDLKVRLDQVEGPRAVYGRLTYKSFDAVDKKLGELAALHAKFDALRQVVRWGKWVMISGIAGFGLAAALQFA